MRIHHMLLVAAMTITPLAAGFAQSTGEDTKADSSKASSRVKDSSSMSNYYQTGAGNGSSAASGSGTTGTAASGAGGGGSGK